MHAEQTHDHDPATTFGRIIRAAREAQGRSRENLARQLDVSSTTVQRWEGGDNLPSVVVGLAVARAVGADLDELADALLPPTTRYTAVVPFVRATPTVELEQQLAGQLVLFPTPGRAVTVTDRGRDAVVVPFRAAR